MSKGLMNTARHTQYKRHAGLKSRALSSRLLRNRTGDPFEATAGQKKLRRPMTVRSFISEHNRLFAFVGASIVLLTFIVKEGWRESVKDLTDQIETDRNLYTLRADSLAIASQITGLGSEIEAVRAKVTATEFGMTLMGSNRAMLLYSWQMSQFRTSIDNLSSLQTKLPPQFQQENTLKKLQIDLNSCQALFRQIGVMLAHASSNATPDGILTEGQSNQIGPATFKLSWQITTLYRQIDQLTSETLAKAQETSERRERSFKEATWISYILYGLGWCISLIGRLYGVEATEVD
jgi:hypothetical protein